MKLAPLFALLGLLAACSQPSCLTTPAPKPLPPDAGDCAQAYAHLVNDLQCPWAKSPGGVTFEQACLADADAGVDLAPHCILSARSCAEAKACRP